MYNVVTRKKSKYAHMRVGMHLDGLAENLQCKISASLETCLRPTKSSWEERYLESLRVIS